MSERHARVEPCREIEKLRALDEVDLVEDQDLGLAQLRQLVENGFALLVQPFAGVEEEQTTSASPAPPQAEVTMARSSRRRGLKMPGVSTKTIWVVPSIAIPRTSARVVCTLRDTIDTFEPTRALRRVDLPAFGAPIRAAKPARVGPLAAGWSSGEAILILRPDPFPQEKVTRRFLFRRPLRGPTPSPLSIPLTRDHPELRRVIRTDALHDRVAGRSQPRP